MIRLGQPDRERAADALRRLDQGQWHDACASAALVIERVLSLLHQQLLMNLSFEEQEKLFAPVKKSYTREGRPLPPWDRMTLGQRVRVFCQANLFDAYEKHVRGKHKLRAAKNIDWGRVVEIRNRAAHPKDPPLAAEEAYWIVSTMHLILLDLTDWQPGTPTTWIARLRRNKAFRTIAAALAATVLILPTALLIFHIQNIRNARALVTKYGSEVAQLMENQGEYALAIWAVQGDKNVLEREVALYRLYKLEAHKIKADDPVEAYRLYERALALPVRSDKEAVRAWQKDLLERMTALDRFRALYGRPVVYFLAILTATGLLSRARRRRRHPPRAST